MADDAKPGSDIIGAVAQLYRSEVARAEGWRARLDTTTNWALTTTAAVISFGLGTSTSHHAVILIGMLLVLNFLFIESRRYRSWDVYLRRVRLLETGFYSPMMRGEPLDERKLRELAMNLESPRIQVPILTAIAQRIKRAYGPVFATLLAAWAVKLSVHDAHNTGTMIERMHVGHIPGTAVGGVVAVIYFVLFLLTAWSVASRPPLTELHSKRRPTRPLRQVFVKKPPQPLAKRVVREEPQHHP